MRHLRRHPRFDTDAPALISVLGCWSERIQGKVADVSESGLKLVLPEPMPTGEIVQVEIGDLVLVGIVRNAEPGSGGVSGIELIHWIERGRLQELLREWAPVHT